MTDDDELLYQRAFRTGAQRPPLSPAQRRVLRQLVGGALILWGPIGPILRAADGTLRDLHLGTARALLRRKLVARTGRHLETYQLEVTAAGRAALDAVKGER